ncbi:threonylcarbamoyl-AMP synthase [Bacteroidia bacterium]|nr:threonylcarbamoyl-AMP synthase [Bacteroidia bacterium]
MKRLQETLQACADVLRLGGCMLYPTDTIWGLGCALSNTTAIRKILTIKHIEHPRSLIILANSIEQVRSYVECVPPEALQLIQTVTKPLTIIYPHARGDARHVAADNGSIGIRIIQHPFCNALITQLNEPIISTSANFTGDPAPVAFNEINPQIVQTVDFIVPIQYDINPTCQASQIVKINIDNTLIVIRA